MAGHSSSVQEILTWFFAILVILVAFVAFGLSVYLMTQQGSGNRAKNYQERVSIYPQQTTANTGTTVLFSSSSPVTTGDLEYADNGVFTVRSAGVYTISANVALDTATGTLGPAQLYVKLLTSTEGMIRGRTNFAPASTTPGSTNYQYGAINTQVYLPEGMQFVIQVYSVAPQVLLKDNYVSVLQTASRGFPAP